MKAIILAAGYATRLYPLTKDKPKALLPIGEKPLLDHIVDKIQDTPAINETILVTNDRFYQQFSDWAAKHKKISVLNDGTTSNNNRLGAIGDLDFAINKSQTREDILVLASDNLFDGTLSEFVKFATSRKDAACIGAYDIQDPKIASRKYGIFELDESSRITAIEEKPEHPKTSYVSMGIYYFPQSSLRFIQDYLKSTAKQDAPGFYATWLLQRMPVYSFLFSGRWYDIGSLEQLEEASRNYGRQSA